MILELLVLVLENVGLVDVDPVLDVLVLSVGVGVGVGVIVEVVDGDDEDEVALPPVVDVCELDVLPEAVALVDVDAVTVLDVLVMLLVEPELNVCVVVVVIAFAFITSQLSESEILLASTVTIFSPLQLSAFDVNVA